MIKLTPKPDGFGNTEGFILATDEPLVIEVDEGHDGFGHVRVVAHVYRGVEVDEDSEPIGAYDGWIGPNKEWTA